MVNFAAQLLELTFRAQKIAERGRLASKEFEVAMARKDGKAMDAARAEMHDALDANFDALVEMDRIKEKSEKELAEKLKKL